MTEMLPEMKSRWENYEARRKKYVATRKGKAKEILRKELEAIKKTWKHYK